MPYANLSDIITATCAPKMPSFMSISKEEVLSVITKLHSLKATGSNCIPDFVLKLLGHLLASYLMPIFYACINLSYHPTTFCHFNTVLLRKLGKGDYSVPRA